MDPSPKTKELRTNKIRGSGDLHDKSSGNLFSLPITPRAHAHLSPAPARAFLLTPSLLVALCAKKEKKACGGGTFCGSNPYRHATEVFVV